MEKESELGSSRDALGQKPEAAHAILLGSGFRFGDGRGHIFRSDDSYSQELK
jgi:hypothetical protein